MTIDMPFAWVPPGQFLMGGPDNDDEKPQRRVVISKGFWMGIHPVTQKEYRSVMGFNPSHFKGDTRPVEMVSWEDAQEFCQKLQELTGMGVRLPTEAEWEYACRAGEGGDYCNGNGEKALEQVGWYIGNLPALRMGRDPEEETQPVGQKKPNRWGLFDMHGNVWEWCEDCYDATFYGSAPTTDPIPTYGDPSFRVMRGGSWLDWYVRCRAAHRGYGEPVARSECIGFRVLLPG